MLVTTRSHALGPVARRPYGAQPMTQGSERRALLLAWGGAALALAVGVLLYTRFSIHGNLTRDEAIYAYGSQQLLDGVPIYLGIFDPKPPLPTMLDALGALAGRAVGSDELLAMRAEFLVLSVLTVVAIYWLALRLWGSVVGAIVAAVTFASFQGFAADALGGPDSKTPGVLLSVVAMALLVQRKWFWAALAGAVAFLDWQPLGVYMLVAIGAAFVVGGRDWGRAWRAAAGAAVPLAATVVFLAIAGGLSQFLEASFEFPLTGVEREPITFGDRLIAVFDVVNDHYGDARVLFWGGLVLVIALLVRRRRDRPAALIVLITLLAFVVLTATDFQGYADLFPFLPYAALGIGGVAAFAERSRVAVVAVGVAAALLAGFSAHRYAERGEKGLSLTAQRAYAHQLERLIDPGERLYALGDPTLHVLTGWRNPTRYVYLGSGVDDWAIEHDFGSFTGWQREILAVDPPVIFVNAWISPRAAPMEAWLARTYGKPTPVGSGRLYVKPAVRVRAARRRIGL